MLAITSGLWGAYVWHRASHHAQPSELNAGDTRATVMPSAVSAAPHAERASTRVATARLAPLVAPQTDVGQVEVCGFGKVELEVDDPYSMQRMPTHVRAAALKVETLMLASTDERVRAAALLMGARPRRDAGARIDRLARLAAVSQDSVVYAIALEACTGWSSVDAGNCALLNRAQWARLDPDNAQAWLALAQEAQQRHDMVGEDEAMYRAAHARGSDTRVGLLPNLVDEALGAQTPLLLRTLALRASWSMQPALELSHAGQAYAYCSANAVADANRRGTCEAMAEALSLRSTSLSDLGIGLAIGRNVGWPTQRLQALQQEQEAISEAGGLLANGVDFSCEAVDRMQGWTRRIGARGELQAMRDVVAQSGRSIEDWSAQYRRNFAVAVAASEAAAAAAPADPTP